MKPTITIGVLTLFVCVCGCSDDNQKYPLAPPHAKAESVVNEARQLKIGSEIYQADFSTITVPETRNKPATRLISVPFLRIHSNSRHPAEPIFGFAGGPGATNMKWDWRKAATFLPDHDFVLVGYRGVDGSTVLDCPEVAKAIKGNDDLLGEESMRMIGRAWSTAAERLTSQGIDLDGYSIVDCIEDNESVRKALRYDRINLLSESYGTRVAYLYGLAHPERIFRSAMISVNPPGHFGWEPRVIDEQLRQYSAMWSKDSTMSAKNPDLYGAMRKMLNTMPGRWIFWSINPGKVRIVTFSLLFQRSTAAMVFDAYVAADRGDPSGLALMSFAFDYVVPSLFTWGDLASKAVSADIDTTRNYWSEMGSAEWPLGSPMGTLLWGPLGYTRWPTHPLPDQFRTLQRSDVQTLLLSGSIDFSTPPQFAANELLPYLKNGKRVVLSECGHVGDVWYVNYENTKRILTSFFDTGVPNTSLNAYAPMDFSVRWGFPTLAKVTLGVIVFIVLLLVLTIVWLVRKGRRWLASEPVSSASNSQLL